MKCRAASFGTDPLTCGADPWATPALRLIWAKCGDGYNVKQFLLKYAMAARAFV